MRPILPARGGADAHDDCFTTHWASRVASTPAHAGVAATVTSHPAVEPVPEWIEICRQARERYRALYPALRSSSRAPGPGVT
jgi:hypothetical protein